MTFVTFSDDFLYLFAVMCYCIIIEGSRKGVSKMPLVEMKDVVKRYGATLSVDHLNLTIAEGEIYGLLGPNGAGKSTTIKMLSGILAANFGEIRLDGISVAMHPIEVKRRIGLVPQEMAIYSGLTAEENLIFFARLYGLRGTKLAGQVEEALDFVGLSDHRFERPETFSGGMKRRLNIACAIMHRPKLIIMDEPTVGIDPQSRNHILESVKKLNALGSTILYTSHYIEEVESICTRVGIMDHGHLIASGTQDELRQMVAIQEKLSIQVAGVHPEAIIELQKHPRITNVTSDTDKIEISMPNTQLYLQDILYILAKHQVIIQSLQRMEPDLESLFLSLTGRKLRD
jgi:ABC-2 type transport system ATP-binding protein